jgi:pyridoxamine 5'-phosphate oxidase
VLDALWKEGYDWEAKRKETFDEMTAAMKATWCHPTPGSPLSSHPPPSSWPAALPKLGDAKTEEEEKLLKEALANFALVVIEPHEVDYVELGLTPIRRTKFEWKGLEKGWIEEALVA